MSVDEPTPTPAAVPSGADAPGTERIERSAVVAIAAMSLAVFAVANDVTAMSVAVTAVEADFDATVSTVQWVVSAYALIFGVMIVPGGRLADMFGRRRILFIGAGIFAAFSLVGALAPNVGVLIASRAAMGAGGALMWPAVLGLIYAILPANRAGLAGGLVIGVAGIGNAAGPLVGGGLTQVASWRWILLLNVPIAALACLVTWRAVHDDDPGERTPIDYPGIALLSISLIALLVALGRAPSEGWTDPFVVGLLVGCVAAMAGFLVRERAAGPAALIPRSVMVNRRFMSACVAALLMSSTFFAVLLYLPQYFQKVFDDDALIAGLLLLPFMGTFAATSFAEGWLLRRVGMKAIVTVGAALFAVGPILLVALLGSGGGYVALVPGLVVLGVGVGLFYSSVTTAGLSALDPSQSSLAGGILYMFQVAGGAVGLGITTSIFLAGANRGVTDGAAELGVVLDGRETTTIQGVVAGTDSSAVVLARFTGEIGQQLVEVVRDSFVTGLRWALIFDAVLAVGGLLVCAFRVGGPLRAFGRDAGADLTAGTGGG